jgi:hypothetical protein
MEGELYLADGPKPPTTGQEATVESCLRGPCTGFDDVIPVGVRLHAPTSVSPEARMTKALGDRN